MSHGPGVFPTFHTSLIGIQTVISELHWSRWSRRSRIGYQWSRNALHGMCVVRPAGLDLTCRNRIHEFGMRNWNCGLLSSRCASCVMYGRPFFAQRSCRRSHKQVSLTDARRARGEMGVGRAWEGPRERGWEPHQPALSRRLCRVRSLLSLDVEKRSRRKGDFVEARNSCVPFRGYGPRIGRRCR